MKQQKPLQLSFAMPSSKPNTHEQRNREAGERILADPERYGGSESLMVRWATLVLARKD